MPAVIRKSVDKVSTHWYAPKVSLFIWLSLILLIISANVLITAASSRNLESKPAVKLTVAK